MTYILKVCLYYNFTSQTDEFGFLMWDGNYDFWVCHQHQWSLYIQSMLVMVKTSSQNYKIILIMWCHCKLIMWCYCGLGGLGHLRRTKKKQTPSESSLSIIRKSEIYQLEQEFYEFALEQFEYLKGRALNIDEEGRWDWSYFSTILLWPYSYLLITKMLFRQRSHDIMTLSGSMKRIFGHQCQTFTQHFCVSPGFTCILIMYRMVTRFG